MTAMPCQFKPVSLREVECNWTDRAIHVEYEITSKWSWSFHL